MRQSEPKRRYRCNHYVPQWYQRRFMLPDQRQKELFRLKLKPMTFIGPDGVQRSENPEALRPAKKLFYQEDLYTTEINGITNTEIEQYFFGPIDDRGKKAIALLCEIEPQNTELPDFTDLIVFLCTQRLRTPKRLAWLASKIVTQDRMELLYHLQRYQKVFGAIWTESIWQIVDASNSATRFIVSDNPVTIYNRECPPGTLLCGEIEDPDIRFTGTHTIFPLSLDKALILTNLSWVRNPYDSADTIRPNPNLYRDAIFMWTKIQTDRMLEEEEVVQMNYIIKRRASDHIAASKPEWLYPEKKLKDREWDRFGNGYLLMPDPRLVNFGGQILIGFKSGGSTGYDEYGRRPWDRDYNDENRSANERETFYRFQGEYSRLFGRKLRGRTLEHWRTEREEVSDDQHQAYLAQERRANNGSHPKREG